MSHCDEGFPGTPGEPWTDDNYVEAQRQARIVEAREDAHRRATGRSFGLAEEALERSVVAVEEYLDRELLQVEREHVAAILAERPWMVPTDGPAVLDLALEMAAELADAEAA